VGVLAVPAHAQSRPTGNDISVVGTLTGEGVPCPTMRGDDGRLFSLRAGNLLKDFKAGDRVRVEGLVAEMSICQQGITIVLKRIEKAG